MQKLFIKNFKEFFQSIGEKNLYKDFSLYEGCFYLLNLNLPLYIESIESQCEKIIHEIGYDFLKSKNINEIMFTGGEIFTFPFIKKLCGKILSVYFKTYLY